MKRTSILLLLLAAFVAACGSEQTTPTATAEPDPTVAATASPEPSTGATPEPAETDAGDDTALEDMIPDELNGVARTDIPGMDTFLASALRAQGMDAEGAEFVFASYGAADTGVFLTAFRIPGINQLAMEQLARMLSGAGGQQGVEAEQVTVGGKSVLRMSVDASAGQAGTVYMYFAEGAAFTIVSQSSDTAAAEQLLGELP